MLIHFTPRNFAEKCCLKLVILEADHLTFEGGGEGGIGDLGKKYPADWFQGEKTLARKYLGGKSSCTGKKNLSWGIILERKSCTVVCWGKNSISRGLEEKILNQAKSPISPSPSKVKWSALKVPITEIFLFSYLKLHLIKITSAKKFCDLNQRRFF